MSPYSSLVSLSHSCLGYRTRILMSNLPRLLRDGCSMVCISSCYFIIHQYFLHHQLNRPKSLDLKNPGPGLKYHQRQTTLGLFLSWKRHPRNQRQQVSVFPLLILQNVWTQLYPQDNRSSN